MSEEIALTGVRTSAEVSPRPDIAESRVAGDEARSLGQRVRVGQRADTRDGRWGMVSRLLRDRQSRQVTHIVVRTRRFFGRELIAPVERVAEVAGDHVLLDVDSLDLGKLSVYRLDEEIKGDVERALSRDEDLRRSGRLMLRVTVLDGALTLRGYVPDRRSQRRAVEVSGRIPGVQGLSDQLMVDEDLGVRVAQTLADDVRTRAYVIQVHARQGIVHLTGALEGTEPSADTLSAAQEIAANVGGVRAVVVEFPGANAVEHLPILPGVGLPVFAADGQLGQLELVVMEQRSRRVTDLVVVGHLPSQGMEGRMEERMDDTGMGPELATRSLLVSARSVAQVTEDAVFLRVDRAAASQLPDYYEDDYHLPESGWQSFDYRREDVRLAVEAGSDRQSRRRAWAGTPRG